MSSTGGVLCTLIRIHSGGWKNGLRKLSETRRKIHMTRYNRSVNADAQARSPAPPALFLGAGYFRR